MTIHTNFSGNEAAATEQRTQMMLLEVFGAEVSAKGNLSWNEPVSRLLEEALARQEGSLTPSGALVVDTGTHRGRSPNDKFIVRDDKLNDHIWWAENQGLNRSQFQQLKTDMLAFASLKDLFVQDLVASSGGPQPLTVRVITETAWASLFMRHLLRPFEGENFAPRLTIVCLPSFKAKPELHGTRSETVIALDLIEGMVLIAGTAYAGEMKKAVFSALNFLMPQQNILPMHCAANRSSKGETTLFFGLSGTGKTTLSADPARELIGDDEHGWCDDGVFNFEHGCYAKVVDLNAALEPDIYAASLAPGSVLENVVLDPVSGQPDFSDRSKTENTRSAYPLSKIGNAAPAILALHPKKIILLTADAFGVLPPVSRLSNKQAVEWFLLGYTAKVAGTERGISEPQATFSACFGAPFLPLPPHVYAKLFAEKLERHHSQCYLLNTGWTGGIITKGSRIKLAHTRAMLRAIFDGSLDRADLRMDEHFGLHVPLALPGIDPDILDPKLAWATPSLYEDAAQKLVLLMQAQMLKLD